MDRNITLTLLGLLPLLLAAPAASAVPLRVVEVGAPDLNCLFAASCTLAANDSISTLPLPGTTSDGRLQSRTSPRGEAGLPGGGSIAYQYRVDLTSARAATAISCVRELAFEAGPAQSFDFDGDGRDDDVYVITRGGLGSAGPTAAERVGDEIRFRFGTPICPGETSFFFGFAATGDPVERVAELGLTLAGPISAEVRVPAPGPRLPGPGGRPGPILPDPPGCVASGIPLERVPRWTNVCRCLSDASLREFRCALRHPGLVLVWNLPWTLPGEPVRVDYTAVRLDPQQPMPRVELLMTGAKRLTEKGVLLPTDEEVTSGHLWFRAPEQGVAGFEVKGRATRP